jgi:predicted RNA-binding protein associated with RNAse of E/G family
MEGRVTQGQYDRVHREAERLLKAIRKGDFVLPWLAAQHLADLEARWAAHVS